MYVYIYVQILISSSLYLLLDIICIRIHYSQYIIKSKYLQIVAFLQAHPRVDMSAVMPAPSPLTDSGQSYYSNLLISK